MSFWTIIIVALGLSADAFAVCVTAATAGYVTDRRATFRLAFHFGLFQFLMPLFGWIAGECAERHVATLDHWIAAGLLAFVGGHMIWTAAHPETETCRPDPTRGMRLVMLSTATSLDAMAVGFSLAFLGIAAWQPSVIIGLVTGGVCIAGILLGNRLRNAVSRWAELAGGITLVLMAVRIVASHSR